MAGEKPGSDLTEPPVMGCIYRSEMLGRIEENRAVPRRQGACLLKQRLKLNWYIGSGKGSGLLRTDHHGRIDLDLVMFSKSEATDGSQHHAPKRS